MEKRTQYQQVPKTQVFQFKFLLRHLLVFRKGGKNPSWLCWLKVILYNLGVSLATIYRGIVMPASFAMSFTPVNLKCAFTFPTFQYTGAIIHSQLVFVSLHVHSFQRRGCFVNIISLAALLVLARANKTGQQAELSLCELWSRRAFECQGFVSHFGPRLATSLKRPSLWEYSMKMCIPKAPARGVSAEDAVKLCSVVCRC